MFAYDNLLLTMIRWVRIMTISCAESFQARFTDLSCRHMTPYLTASYCKTIVITQYFHCDVRIFKVVRGFAVFEIKILICIVA